MNMKIFKRRSETILKQMKNESVMILFSAKHKIRSNDTQYVYRQNSNFYYLSGFLEDNSALVLIKADKKEKILLFVQPKDKFMELWHGKRLGIKTTKKLFVVDDVYDIQSFDKRLKQILKNKKAIYFNLKNYDMSSHVKKIVKRVTQHLEVSDLIQKMRLIKSNDEIKVIKKAIKISKNAHHKVMQIKKDGLFEYELQAKFEYEFKTHGAFNDAYTAIVAGGNNANTLHYIKNSNKLQSGDLVLIDAGCEYEMYASDITRTLPISGKFTKAQREVYEMVLAVQEKIISMIKPGVKRSKLQKKARYLLCKGMVELNILKGHIYKLIQKNKDKKYYPHGIGHYMGLDVHDPCPYKDKNGKEILLKKGMVLTIEPGIYLDKCDKNVPKQYRGIGIRIEDDILVTKNGYENLSIGIKKSIDDIEAMSRRNSIQLIF